MAPSLRLDSTTLRSRSAAEAHSRAMTMHRSGLRDEADHLEMT
jgi:hypothetical protein